ncbi:MAG: hypothetical protein IJU35_04450 [Paludibacteraceae bacterium]|nr:hypothetical protein [Paludibacteraceae bacterium]
MGEAHGLRDRPNQFKPRSGGTALSVILSQKNQPDILCQGWSLYRFALNQNCRDSPNAFGDAQLFYVKMDVG